MPTTITSSQVVTDFGAFYIDQGQNENNIHQRLREPFGTKDAFRIIDTEDTVLREVNTEFAEVLQGFQTAFTPKGGVTFMPKQIPLFNVKVDQSFYPDALKNQWLAFLTSNNLDRTTWPFVRWFIEMYVMGQIQADIETKSIYGGVHSDPTPSTANNAEDVMDGVEILINNAITAGSMTPLTTGAPSSDAKTWCTQVEDFCKQIPELYWGKNMKLNMSRTLALRYKEGRRLKYNSNYAQVSDAMAVQDFESIMVVGRASMAGKNKIWTTVENNAVMGLKGGSNQNIVELEKVDRLVKVYTDWWMGIGFVDDGLVLSNDQDLGGR